MKVISFVVLCILAAAVKGSRNEETMEAVRTLSAECLKELGASDAVFDELLTNLPATNKEVKCLRACLMKKANVLSADGKFIKDSALKVADMHTGGDPDQMKVAEAIIDTCQAISVPDDHCEAAEMYKMCILSEANNYQVQNLM